MSNKFLIALLAVSVFAVPAFAGSNNQFENWKRNRHAPVVGNERHDNRYYHRRRHHGNGNNYWHGKNHNYWHGNNNNFYNDPNFWGGVAGGLIGGAIIDQYNVQPVGPGPGCFIVLQPVEGPNNGVVYREVVLCN
jgi:hypothetical protein